MLKIMWNISHLPSPVPHIWRRRNKVQIKVEVHLSRQMGEINLQEEQTAWKGQLDTGKVRMQWFTWA